MTRYISFIGFFEIPENNAELESQFPMSFRTICVGEDENGNSILEEEPTGFLENMEYKSLPSEVDEVCLFVTPITGNIGHLVAECVGGNWNEATFCFLKDGLPVKS